ncbi:MAG TPA: T9SS type A sorting domain-containing protein, partial [Cytophagaceae bacterium]
TNDQSYLDRAILNLRYSVYPGQLSNGRWLDGHNANSRYQSIIIQNTVPTIEVLPANHVYQGVLDTMVFKAINNLVAYTYKCNSATGFRWLLCAYGLNNAILTVSLKDSISRLIGRYINQSAVNGKFLDVPTMGKYMELLGVSLGTKKEISEDELKVRIYPNPSPGEVQLEYSFPTTEGVQGSIFDTKGKLIENIDLGQRNKETTTLDFSHYSPGIYFMLVKSLNHNRIVKIVID